jgi:CRP/FNR family transcriptional regulator, cyclic AMP receptor protein
VAGPSVELLQRVPLFAELKPRELERLSGSFRERTFDEGETPASEGESGYPPFFVIESGEAVVTVHGEERGRLGPGDYFGDVAIIDRGERGATIQAKTPLKCYSLAFWDFRPLVERDARIAWPLLQAMATRLRAAGSVLAPPDPPGRGPGRR